MNLALFIPELCLVAFAIIVILLDLFIEQKRLLMQVSLAGLVIAGGITVAMWGGSYPAIFNNMLAVDNFALFFKLLFAGIAFLVILASADYVSKFARFQGEYYALILLATLGMMLMVRGTAKLIGQEQKIDVDTERLRWLDELMASVPDDRWWMMVPLGVWLLIIMAVMVAALQLRAGRIS